MGLVVSIKLNNGTTMHLVGNKKSGAEAKNLAIKLSPRLFGDKDLHVTTSSKIVKAEEWDIPSKAIYSNGNRKFIVSFLMNDVTQFLNIDSSGVKSAYNNIRFKFGIQDKPFMMIYDVDQSVSKKSAMQTAKVALRDNNKLNIVINKSIEKIKNTPELKQHNDKVKLIIAMLKDFKDRKFLDINPNKIIAVVAVFIYFSDPSDFVLDTGGYSSNNENDSIELMVCSMNEEIYRYMRWINAGDPNIVIV